MSLKMIEEKYDLLFNSVSLIVQRYGGWMHGKNVYFPKQETHF